MATRLAAIYARVSTDEQMATSGIPSTATQIQKCREKARALGIPVAPDTSGLIVEEVHPGGDLRWQGTEFMRLIERGQRGDFTDFICLDVDRFCRGGPHAFLEQEGYLMDAHVAIHYVTDDIPENMPFRTTILTARAEGAQWWRDKLVEASSRARVAHAAAGNFVTGWVAPFGWQWVTDPTRRTRMDRPLKIGLEPHPENGPILLHMYEHVANGGSVHALKDWLETQGVPPPTRAPIWHTTSIRRILENSTNWGERRAHITRLEPRKEGVRRDVTLKTAKRNVTVPLDERYVTDPACLTPIPGLTRDLAMRALARLEDNRLHSRRRAVAPDSERALRGLLFNGYVRCTVCGAGMRLKRDHPTGGSWRYTCYHSGGSLHHEPPVSIGTRTLDSTVWGVAMRAIADPTFVERLLEKTDEVAGPLARARSLQRQLDDATHERDIQIKHLRRLDPDDPDNASLLASIELDVRQLAARLADLRASLDATQAEVEQAQARRAALDAFRRYADGSRERLADMTPLERRQFLLALRVEARVSPTSAATRLWVKLDARYLPGAAGALSPAARERPTTWVDFSLDAPIFRFTEQTLLTEGAVPFQPVTAPAMTAEDWERAGYRSEEDFQAQEATDAGIQAVLRNSRD